MLNHAFTLTGSAEQGNLPRGIQFAVIDLRQPPVSFVELCGYLSEDEQERAQRFRLPHLQQRFSTGRGMLRLLLGQACKRKPEQLRFSYQPQGKPSLPDFPTVHFNASHSGDFWSCAIGSSPLGLDIEHVRPIPNSLQLARRFFASSECDAIEQFPEEDRLPAFFRCWTRKEAYVKALGDGLSRSFSTFAVSCGEEEVSDIHDELSPECWHAHSFLPCAGYVGALAIRNGT